MTNFATETLPHLPPTIEGEGSRNRLLRRTLKQLRAPDQSSAKCAQDHNTPLDQSICLNVAAFQRVTDILMIARRANVVLP